MSFCPKCRFEYLAGFTTCPDCEEKLVTVLPEEEPEIEPEPESYENWVQIARLTSQQIAEMVVEMLRDNEIRATALSGSGPLGITGQMGFASHRPIVGSYSVMVPRESAAEADKLGEALLGDIWRDSRTDEEESE